MISKKDIIKLIIELFVVFLGVTAAFLLNNWAEERRARETETIYLKSLHHELIEDIERIDTLISYYENKKELLTDLIMLIDNRGDKAEIEDLCEKTLLTFRFFKGGLHTWESLKNSGELKLIKNIQIKILTAKLYTRYKDIEEHSDILQSFIENRILDHFIKNVRIDGSDIIFMKRNSAHENYFANLVTTYYLIILDHLRSLRETHQMCRRVKTVLVENLGIKIKAQI